MPPLWPSGASKLSERGSAECCAPLGLQRRGPLHGDDTNSSTASRTPLQPHKTCNSAEKVAKNVQARVCRSHSEPPEPDRSPEVTNGITHPGHLQGERLGAAGRTGVSSPRGSLCGRHLGSLSKRCIAALGPWSLALGCRGFDLQRRDGRLHPGHQLFPLGLDALEASLPEV